MVRFADLSLANFIDSNLDSRQDDTSEHSMICSGRECIGFYTTKQATTHYGHTS